jgi:hypothetical protein
VASEAEKQTYEARFNLRARWRMACHAAPDSDGATRWRCPFCAGFLRARQFPRTMRRPKTVPLVPVAEGCERCCSIGEAAEVMRAANISSALIGTEAMAAGIITERDLARALAAGLGPREAISQVAVQHPVLVAADMSVLDAAAKMLHDKIRHLLVVEDGELVGILSIRDIMGVLLHSLSPETWPEPLREGLRAPTEIWVG